MPNKKAWDHKDPKFSRLLIVEGIDDLLFYAEMLEDVDNTLNKAVCILPMGGKSILWANLETTLRDPILLQSKEAIGIVVDADDSTAATIKSFENRLLDITGQHVQNGQWTTKTPTMPRLGLFVVGGSGGHGEIETVVWEAWSNDPRNAPLKGCVDTFLSCAKHIPEMEAELAVPPRPKYKVSDKASVGSVLAILHEADPRLGPAAQANRLDLGLPEFAPLVKFFSELLN